METIHLTLAFLGDVEESALPLLRELRLGGKKHSLPIQQARFWKHNQIIWVGPDTVPQDLGVLATDLKQQLAGKSLETEERPFAAHITLIRKARAPAALPPVPSIFWPVDEVVLVRSHLSGKGASYEVLQRYPLS
jgi:RNA 2',3'-cyclic 3'-phosphodiesterase